MNSGNEVAISSVQGRRLARLLPVASSTTAFPPIRILQLGTFVTDVDRRVGGGRSLSEPVIETSLPGHWIQNCPKNDDPASTDTKRFVRVTGIPRSFLKTVETPTTGEGSSGGAMLTADGGFVRAVPDQ